MRVTRFHMCVHRCVLLINPDRGQRCPAIIIKKGKKAVTGVHPKVRDLLRKMGDLQWRED